jgi:hypothetical protein
VRTRKKEKKIEKEKERKIDKEEERKIKREKESFFLYVRGRIVWERTLT